MRFGEAGGATSLCFGDWREGEVPPDCCPRVGVDGRALDLSDSVVVAFCVVLVDVEGDDGREVRSADGLSVKRRRHDQGEHRMVI